MKNIAKIISVVIPLFSMTYFYGQTQEQKCNTISTLIKGVYQSKNLLIEETVENSIQSILINNKEYKLNTDKTIFELDLSNLNLGQNYEIKIIHCECKSTPYKILNPDVLK